jgi:hypothetical protein
MNKIALLNDAFRTTLTGGTVLLTLGVQELPDMVKAAAIRKVVEFDDFNEDNDPYGEHDFGSLRLCGRRFSGKSIITTAPWSTAAKTRATPSRPPAS